MKAFSFLLALLVAGVMFVACKGDIGPEGPKGATGEAGATGSSGIKGDKGAKGDKGVTGKNGTTEVIIFSDPNSETIPAGVGVRYGVLEWHYNNDPAIRTMIESSAIYVYLKLPRDPEEWVLMPGTVFVPGGAHQAFAMATRFTNTSFLIELVRSEGAGALSYSGHKIIFVPRSASARQDAIDYSDYEAVKSYYNLPD